MKLEFYWHGFEIYSNITFHENFSSRGRVFPRGQTDGRADGHNITELIVVFRNFATAAKKSACQVQSIYIFSDWIEYIP
jgi:hypothetical protein